MCDVLMDVGIERAAMVMALLCGLLEVSMAVVDSQPQTLTDRADEAIATVESSVRSNPAVPQVRFRCISTFTTDE